VRRAVTALLGIAALGAAGAAPTPAEAGFSGKNGRIYFESNLHREGLQTDIYSMTPRGTKMRRVRALPDDQNEPAVSPDGSRLSFWMWDEGCCPAVWQMNRRGGALSELADSTVSASPAYGAGGERIAYVDTTGIGPGLVFTGIFTVPADGGGSPSPLIADDGQRVRSPSFSADGSRVVYEQDDGTYEQPNWNIHVADANGTNRRRVTDWPGPELSPDIHPNGRRIVFAGKRGAASPGRRIEIYDVRIDGDRVRRLTRNGLADSDPAFSPDGKRIVWTRKLGTNRDIFKMRANGSNHHPLTRERRLVLAPDWATRR